MFENLDFELGAEDIQKFLADLRYVPGGGGAFFLIDKSALRRYTLSTSQIFEVERRHRDKTSKKSTFHGSFSRFFRTRNRVEADSPVSGREQVEYIDYAAGRISLFSR